MLQGDASKARDQLGWQPKVNVNIQQLARMMVAADLAEARAEAR
jgi:GDP-D-mannose dehydratase